MHPCGSMCNRHLTASIMSSTALFRALCVKGGTHPYLRLKNYFINSATPPHLWFHKWSVPLQHLGVSYAQGTVAHLDLSPRATASMETTNQRLFTDMVAEDIKWFFGLLSFWHQDVPDPILWEYSTGVGAHSGSESLSYGVCRA